jgi:hypothetical protein
VSNIPPGRRDQVHNLTHGLGLQVAPNSDQILLVRAGELTKADDAGGTYYVVHVDIETG